MYCQATVAKAITLNGTNRFNGNYMEGLWITSLGAIKVNNLTASDNGAYGAYLYNQSGVKSSLAITGYGTFQNNGHDGLHGMSNGDISLNSITGSFNDGDGAYLDNKSLSTTLVKVTLTGTSTFIGNKNDSWATGSGLVIYTDGPITANNLIASLNEANGVDLDNATYYSGVGTPGITLMGVNIFNGNAFDGLYFDSIGTVSLNKVTGDDNGEDGLDGETVGSILVAGGSMTANSQDGWELGSTAAGGTSVTLRGVWSFGNLVKDENLTMGVLLKYRY